MGAIRLGEKLQPSRRKTHRANHGPHGYRYPVWQFTESGVLPGFDRALSVLASHDEWMQAAFFVSANPHLGRQTPVQMMKAGELESVLDAAEVYGEHGAA